MGDFFISQNNKMADIQIFFFKFTLFLHGLFGDKNWR